MSEPTYELRPVGTDAAEISAIASLLRRVFPDAEHFTEKVLHWQYAENPHGTVIGMNAWYGSDLAAHYVTIPMRAKVFGKEERGALSLNTATHPDHQGKGLFKKLANATYDRAVEQGLGFIVGVANAQSTFGFTQRLGFQLVTPLKAMIGFGKAPLTINSSSGDFEPIRDATWLAWRTAHPAYPYATAREKDLHYVLSQRTMKGFRFVLYASEQEHDLALPSVPTPLMKSFIAAPADVDPQAFMYMNVPMRFRPSPLNLIYKDLTGKDRVLDPSKVHFQAVDVDVI